MTPGVLKVVFALRDAGELFGKFGHVVARDACHAVGCELRVTSNRTVNVRKSNRPIRSLFGLDRENYELWAGNSTVISPEIPLTPERLNEALVLMLRNNTPSRIPMPVDGEFFGPEWATDRVFRELSVE